MTVYVLCVDQERGKYMAFDAHDPDQRSFSYTGMDEAIGRLVREQVAALPEGRCYLSVERIREIDLREPKP